MVTPNAGEDAEKLDRSYIDGGSIKCYSHPGKQFDSFKFHMTQELYSLTLIQRKENFQKSVQLQLFIAALFVIAKNWKQPRCPSTGDWLNKF